MRQKEGFCGIGLLVGLLVAVLVVAYLETGVFSPSSPPIRVKAELDAWNQAIRFIKARPETPGRAQFPIYSPAFVRQVSPGTWEVTVTADLVDEYGVRTGRQVFKVLEKWDKETGWTLSELSVTP